MIGSAEVPAETQGELLDVYTCSTKTGGLGDPDDDDELYWANETQDETELILKATQELEQEAEFPVFRSSAFQPIPDPPKQQKSNLQFSKEPVQADHENGQEQQRSQPSNRNTPSESSSQLSQYRDQELPPIMQPNHFDTANTTFAGFQTGRGATMAPPSSAALRKACAMLASSPLESGAQTENQNEDERSAGEQSEDEDEDSQQLMPPPAFMPSRNAQQASKGSPLQIMLNGDITSSPAHEEEDTAANISFGLSFQTARGKTLNDPSNESMERARRLIAPSSSPETLPGSQQHQQQRLTEAEATDSPTVNRQRDARNALKRPPMILRLAQLGDPSASAPASPATLRPRPHTLSAYGETPVRSRGTQRQSLPLLPPPRSVFKTPQQLGSSHSARCAESKTVLQIRPTNQTSMPGPRTPCTPGVKLAIRAPLKPSTTPAEPPRRVNNQMHGSARRQMPKGAFKPPFKNGVRPPPGPILSQSSSQQDPTTEAAGQLVLSKHAARLPTSQRQGFDDRRFTQPSSRQRNGKFKAVFDLSGVYGFPVLQDLF